MNQLRFWFFLQQNVDRPIGGVKQIYTVASIISELGYSVHIVQGTSEFRPSWFPANDLNFSTIGVNEFSFKNLNPTFDIVVIPETFLPLLSQLSHLKVVIFNQNMHYLFGEKMNLDPSSVLRAYSLPNILSVWTVSASDYSYAIDMLPISPLRIFRIVNAVEGGLFSFSFSANKSITYMPRKNESHSRIVVELIKNQSWFRNSGWSFHPINNKSLSDVSSILRDSSIFLSFGYPEGFGLPLAEAIISGCFLVGYDGIGGSEISDLCKPFDVFTSVPFRDFHSFVQGVKTALIAYDPANQKSLRSKLFQASALVASRYSSSSMTDSVSSIIDSLESMLKL